MKRIIDLVRNNIPVLVFCDSNILFIQRVIAVITDVIHCGLAQRLLGECYNLGYGADWITKKL